MDAVVCNGDLVHGEGKKETTGHLTTDVGEQADIAADILQRIKAKRRYIVRGTPFHVDDGQKLEDEITDRCHVDGIGDEWALAAEGLRFHFRHVGGRSDIPYGQGTPLYREAVRELIQAAEEGYEAAEVVVRSHVHYFFRVDGARATAVSLPCMQLPGSVFGRTLRTMYYHVGLVVFRVAKGQPLVVDKRLMQLRIMRERKYVAV